MWKPTIRGLSKLGLAAAALAMAGPRQPVKPFVVYHDGADIIFAPEVTGTHPPARLGPWTLGERLSASDETLRDKRLNLYVVFPGGQYRSAARPEYDHNLVVNKYTVDGKPREWDIFWCFALDSTLPLDLRSERDLLVAAHQTFRPGDRFAVQLLPANAVMKERLSVNKVDDLKRFRRKDGSLPRLLIVPAHLAVRATAERPPIGPLSPDQ
ncbi:MAG TPA: hypothetical protein VKE93_06665 [Candidatus Angelobacter sp.]|nr:hypothetical protein [Candidatus Angelobacter sp.]